jgi:hypothetical protein
VRDLTSALGALISQFPSFVADARRAQRSTRFKLLKRYQELGAQCCRAEEMRVKFKQLTCASARAIRELSERNDSAGTATAEVRAMAGLLGNALGKVQTSHAAVRDLQRENDRLRAEIAESARSLGGPTALGALQSAILELEVGLACDGGARQREVAHAAAALRAHADGMRMTLLRVADLEDRIARGRLRMK